MEIMQQHHVAIAFVNLVLDKSENARRPVRRREKMH
jgi:hypothetical protein